MYIKFFKKDRVMPSSDKKKEYDINYAKTNLKRIPLDVQKDVYINIKAAADNAGESVNRYIKQAIQMRMDQEQ